MHQVSSHLDKEQERGPCVWQGGRLIGNCIGMIGCTGRPHIPTSRGKAAFIPRLQHFSQLKGMGATLSSCRQSEDSENYDTQMKETEDHANKWKDILCLWIKEWTSLKCTILTQSNLQIQCNLYQISM